MFHSYMNEYSNPRLCEERVENVYGWWQMQDSKKMKQLKLIKKEGKNYKINDKNQIDLREKLKKKR